MPQIMPLTLWGAGGGLCPCPPKARPNRLQTRQGEKTARWCTWAYIEGESLKPNAVSNDLERFEKGPGRLTKRTDVTYIEGESLKPNAVSSDLERFGRDADIGKSIPRPLDFLGRMGDYLTMQKVLVSLTLGVLLLGTATLASANNAAELFGVQASPSASILLGREPHDPGLCLTDDNYPMSDVVDIPGYIGLRSMSEFRQNPMAVIAVRRNIELFSEAIKKRFALYLQRSGRYITVMTDILKKEGIPSDIVFMSMIESGFSTKALSPKKAAGPWQFIPETGKRYGLRIDKWVDERRDPVKSTHAAAHYMKDLYGMFNSWELAMAAYNAGEMKIARAIDHTNSNDFWAIASTRQIKNETKEYVPRFIAAKLIADDPEAYGFEDLQYEDGLQYEEVHIPYQLSLADIGQAAGVEPEAIKELNPELKKQRTPPGDDYVLKLPVGTRAAFIANMPDHASAPGKDEYASARHTRKRKAVASRQQAGAKRAAGSKRYVVKKGDNLWSIARRNGIDTQDIIDANDINRSTRLKPGQRLQIPADS